MDEVLDTVEAPIDSVDVVDQSPAESAPTGSRSERIHALQGKALDHYRLTGDVDGAEKLSDVKSASSPDASVVDDTESGAASDPAKPESKVESPADKSARKQANDAKRLRELGKYEGIVERQNAEIAELRKLIADKQSGTSALPEAEKPAIPTERPKRPRMTDAKYDGDRGGERYEADWDAYETAMEAWHGRSVDERLNGERQNQTFQQSEAKWNDQIKTAKARYKDYESVAFNQNVPIAYSMIGLLQSMEDGADKTYHYAKDLANATRIAELTVMEGEHVHKDYASFMKWVKSDPDRAVLYGEKLAIAKAEIAKLATSKSAPTPPRKPLKEVIAAANRPSAEVDTPADGAPVTDPVQDALKRGDFGTYKRLKNEADMRERKAR